MEKMAKYMHFVLESKESGKRWSKEKISEYMGSWNDKTFEKDFNKIRAALWILELTLNRNPGRGFNLYDRETGFMDVVRRVYDGKPIQELEMSVIRSKIHKYAEQLSELSNEKLQMGQGTLNRAYAWARKNWSNYPENHGKPAPEQMT